MSELKEQRIQSERLTAITQCAIFGASAAIGLYVVAKVAAWIVGVLA